MNGIYTKPKLLVVDDEVEVCSILKEFLAAQFIIEIAHDGASALQKAETLKPDIVLLDIRMPVMGGEQALKKIKSSLPNTQIIMLTAIGSNAIAEKCLKEGAFRYIMKPVDLDILEDAINSALKAKGQTTL